MPSNAFRIILSQDEILYEFSTDGIKRFKFRWLLWRRTMKREESLKQGDNTEALIIISQATMKTFGSRVEEEEIYMRF